ncbi:Hypothetical protein, putative [Bodo saltans]|uniref:N-acetyltransferase domain-containing protein n=1 Tax=Bodo saltans TaxID=75058 RepID=A0A0S4IZI8_BODSA|nr:Hypothetical protein, putative [Bodo saltans]|eukprot:CUG63052.1 Hypothetical protein, putative [Bodo saltans]
MSEYSAPPVDEHQILSSSEVTQLAAFYSTITLTPDQMSRIAQRFLEASAVEKSLIARVYCNLFSDATFVQRLLERGKRFQKSMPPHSGAGPLIDYEEDEDDEDEIGFDDSHYQARPTGNRTKRGPNKKKGDTPSSPLPQQREMRLANVAEEITPRLIGDGPFTLEFGLVLTEDMRTAVVNLYSKQFVHPDAKTLAKMVIIPRSQSTRTRKNIKGSYTWFLKCLSTNEVVSCVTALVHRKDANTSIVEVPLFATGSGYKKNGFAKLLNVALLEFCVDHMVDCPLVVVSADPKAVPFWAHLGFREMSRSEKKSIEFLYEHSFFKFQDSVPMTISLAELKARREERRQIAWRSRSATTTTANQNGSGTLMKAFVIRDESREASSDGTNEGDVIIEESRTPPSNEEENDGASVVLETILKMPRFLLSGSVALPYQS